MEKLIMGLCVYISFRNLMNSTELTENKSTNFAAPRVTDSICQHASHSMKAEKRTQISKTCSFHLDSNCSCFTTVYIIMTLWVFLF